ncbi:ABC transporter permease [Celeribacter halophilus]|uniref:ABC transporter permease n=1 Tax=Celeribacter halophilus TaxID=576117 RepID=UPI0026E2A835|nr:ABC transporter permease [Celeribacter halophilus]MDO6725150.1 ABC transporter permease [Celeribacter halophilus]
MMRRLRLPAISPAGVLFALLGTAALFAPFMSLAANRIVAGDGVAIWNVAGPQVTVVALLAVVAALVLGLFEGKEWVRLTGAAIGLLGLVALLALGGPILLEGAGAYARVSPSSGFWYLLAVMGLLAADAVTQLAPKPAARAALLVGVVAMLAVLFQSGALTALSISNEFSSRKGAFGDALGRHLWLAFGSLAMAVGIGLPLGIMCHRSERLRSALLPALSFLQTIPSLAMFGIMIPILGWIGDNFPAAQAIGIAGIGFAPAFLALVLYSLLPVVSNTIAGLHSTPPAVLDAARGMGMTPSQRLWRVEFPLGLPVILTGIRIVLVQNIGLAVIAGLVGGGGFGTFVFQGLNQTATDLILLGALPTVVLALVAAVVMDIVIDLTKTNSEQAA